ncbi:flagellar protein FlaG [Paenibacillus nasutitermitis]|uniref:Flagellin n=1 Tax=Paenibacillus nasutitermitis TaxID=1652958 RepID=A0A917E294_9BACL|nr:flagellar protein FlaG [Paenibacillus nasutitermitis]GGD92195.1 flagellin [Paenibacillus nasutitermitis]
MNVQFSLNASTSSPVRQPVDQSLPAEASNSKSSTQLDTASIKTTKELLQLGKKGVTVSVGEEHLIKAIDRAVKLLQGPQTTLDISIHEKTHTIMVKVLNKDTGELIREVPPEKTMDLVAKMMEIAGILIDEKV